MRVTSPSYLLDQSYECATEDESSYFEYEITHICPPAQTSLT